MRITLADYMMGRNALYPDELTPEIQSNAWRTIAAANALITLLEVEGLVIEDHPVNKSPVSSGWRPPQINSQVKNAAVRSKHMTGEAIDLYDPEGAIDDYLMSEAGQKVLVDLRLWLEHPSATKNWSHVQIVAPRSGNRVFYP